MAIARASATQPLTMHVHFAKLVMKKALGRGLYTTLAEGLFCLVNMKVCKITAAAVILHKLNLQASL